MTEATDADLKARLAQDGSVEAAGDHRDERVLAIIGRAALDDYLAAFSRPRPTDQQRLAFIEGNLGLVWKTVVRKLETGAAVTEIRLGTHVRVVRIEAVDLHLGPKLSDARLTIMGAGWGYARGGH